MGMRVGSFDLSRALHGIPLSHPKYGRLVRTLKNLEAARSVNTDLEEARQALDVAGKIPFSDFGSVPPEGPIQVEGLFVHALLLYCKATHSASKARHRIDFIGNYSTGLREDHKMVTSLRDSVIAHYGTGADHPSGPWYQDHVVLHQKPEGFVFSYPQMRVAHKAETLRALTRLVDSSLEYVVRYGTDRQHELAEELRPLLATDQYIQGLLNNHPFDEVAYFGFVNPPSSQDRILAPAGQPPHK